MTVVCTLVACALCGLIGYGFGVVDTLNDIRIKRPDLYEALRKWAQEDDNATD